MKTIRDVLSVAAPRRLAEELLSFVLSCKRIELYMQYDRPLIEKELEQMRALWRRCQKGEPLEYVTGETEFLGCKLKIDRRALIPRPETEILADLIAKQSPSGGLWDVCTGSGCLGIGLKKKFPSLQVVLSDLSLDALALAKENAVLNQVDVEIRHSDLLQAFDGQVADWVVCNPPYITRQEYLELHPSVKDFEPEMALVGGERGTEFYERLQRELPDRLRSGSKVFFEIGMSQGSLLKQIFSGTNWKNPTLQKDWAGKDRFFFLEKQ